MTDKQIELLREDKKTLEGKFSDDHEHEFIECDDLPATCLCGKQEYEN